MSCAFLDKLTIPALRKSYDQQIYIFLIRLLERKRKTTPLALTPIAMIGQVTIRIHHFNTDQPSKLDLVADRQVLDRSNIETVGISVPSEV